MKNLFTLFLISITTLGFSQRTFTQNAPKHYRMDPNSRRPSLNRSGVAGARSSMACDTIDALDYNLYEELYAANLQISFSGSWYAQDVWASEMTSTFLTAHSSNLQAVSYAAEAFDTLAFADYANQSQYSMSLAGSTISFDSMGIFIGISGDTVSAHGTMTNDSLVFRIYSITGGIVGNNPVKTISFVGYDGLAPFLLDPGYLHYASFPVGQTFNQGQGFAVRADYYNADTSSHCLLSYSFADSCGTVNIQGQDYASPAYPSPFIKTAKYLNVTGSNFYGEIDSASVGGNVDSATVYPASNAVYYNLSSYGIARNCSYVYIQNWQMIPYVTITSSLGVSFTGDTVLLPCDHATGHTVAAHGTGDLAGAQYSWSSSQNTPSINVTTPGIYTVTVSNPLGCSATAAATVMYPNGADVNPAFNAPDSICVGAPAAFVNTSSDVTGYSSKWNLGQGPVINAVNAIYTYTAAGTYPVTLTMDSAGCTFSVTQNVTVTSVCVGIQNIAFENSISVLPNPSNGNININITGVNDNVNITVYNIIGQTVKSYTSTDAASVFNKNMDLSNLNSGTYLMKIQTGGKIATKKLVITK